MSDSPHITAGNYSFTRTDYAYAEVEGTSSSGSLTAGAGVDFLYAYVTGGSDEIDYSDPYGVSGSLTSITLTYVNGAWIGFKNASSGSLSSDVTLPSGGQRGNRASSSAETDAASFLSTITVANP